MMRPSTFLGAILGTVDSSHLPSLGERLLTWTSRASAQTVTSLSLRLPGTGPTLMLDCHGQRMPCRDSSAKPSHARQSDRSRVSAQRRRRGTPCPMFCCDRFVAVVGARCTTSTCECRDRGIDSAQITNLLHEVLELGEGVTQVRVRYSDRCRQRRPQVEI